MYNVKPPLSIDRRALNLLLRRTGSLSLEGKYKEKRWRRPTHVQLCRRWSSFNVADVALVTNGIYCQDDYGNRIRWRQRMTLDKLCLPELLLLLLIKRGRNLGRYKPLHVPEYSATSKLLIYPTKHNGSNCCCCTHAPRGVCVFFFPPSTLWAIHNRCSTTKKENHEKENNVRSCTR